VKLSRRLPFIVWCFVQLLGLDSEKGRNLELVFSNWYLNLWLIPEVLLKGFYCYLCFIDGNKYDYHRKSKRRDFAEGFEFDKKSKASFFVQCFVVSS
jgi:hypothetical protein